MFFIVKSSPYLSAHTFPSVFEIITLIIAACSALCAFLVYFYQRRQAKKTGACDLAKYYAETIIPRASFISYVFSANSYVSTCKDVFSLDKISVFTKTEMEKIMATASEDEKKIIESNKAPKPDTLLFHRIRLSEAKDELEMYNNLLDRRNTDDALQKNQKILDELFLLSGFECDRATLLNDLEAFSMRCRYKVANEKFLYQSLHQTFLADIQMLYYSIAVCNINGEDKYFTNLIWLFNVWKKRLIKNKTKNEKKVAKANEKAVRAQKKAEAVKERTQHGGSI